MSLGVSGCNDLEGSLSFRVSKHPQSGTIINVQTASHFYPYHFHAGTIVLKQSSAYQSKSKAQQDK